MLVLRDVRGNAVHGKGPVLDAIGIPAYNGAKVGMNGLGVIEVLCAIIVAQDNVLRMTVLVVDEEVGEACAVGYEACIDARCRDCVFCKDAGALG